MKIVSLFFFILFTSSLAYAQTSSFAVEASETSEDKISDFNQDKLATIDAIKQNMAETKALLMSKEARLGEEKDEKKKLILESELKRLKDRYSKIKLNLISVITDIKIDDIKKEEVEHKRDLMQEAQDLLGPAFDTIHRISAKPRKIEALRKEIATYQEKIALTDLALKNIERVTTSPDFKALLPDLEEYIDEAKYNVGDVRQEFIIKAEHLNRDLTDLTKDDKSVFDAVTSLMKEFLSTKGKNLIIAILSFFFTFWFLKKLREKVILRLIANKPDEWFFKPINALYGFISVVIATGFSILSLYLVGDWVLVTISVLLISATLWASKDYIHKYLAQGRLILNLGTIKEGELVIYNSLPWRVKNISFVTTFENDFLDSTQIKIEISEIFKMHSRKILPNEQWFPTRSGDWVVLSDGTYGQIKIQTAEQVVIEQANSQRRYYPVIQYLGLTPINLSHGFFVDFNWGLDYQDQEKLLTTILPRMKQQFLDAMKNYQFPTEENILDFHSAGASSLNLYIFSRFKGDFAANRLQIQRDLQAIMLTICNKEKLNIPYNQLTVHMQEKHS